MNEDNSVVSEETVKVPSYDELRRKYDGKWKEQKEAFWKHLKENFEVLTSQFRTGRQEVYVLTVSDFSDEFEKAFREFFHDTGYQASIGEAERLGSGVKKSKKLYIRLPDCYNGTA